jgi:hypothetical protein
VDQSRDIIDIVRSKRGLAQRRTRLRAGHAPPRAQVDSQLPLAARVKRQCQERQGITSGKPIHNMEM